MAGGEFEVGALGALIAIGILGSLFFRKTGVNDVMLLIILGIVIGPVTGLVDASALAPLVPTIGAIALIMVVFSEGLNLSFKNLRDNAFDVLLLGTLTFVLCFASVYLIATVIFAWKMTDALLLAAMLCASAPEIISLVVDGMKMGNKLRQIAKLEAVLADSAAVILVFAFIGLVGSKTTDMQFEAVALSAAISAMISIALAGVCALVWQNLIMQVHKRYAHLSALAIACLLFALSGTIGASGVLAAFSFGFFLGNRKSGETLRLFQEEFAFVIRTFFFIYLGLLFAPAQFANTGMLLIGICVSLAIIITRRVAVALFAFFERAAREDKALVSLTQRGLTVAVLAAIVSGVYAQQHVASPPFATIVLIVVLVTNLFSTVGIFRHERQVERAEAEFYEERIGLAGGKKARESASG